MQKNTNEDMLHYKVLCNITKSFHPMSMETFKMH